MQTFHDNFFYHSKLRLGADGCLEEERRQLGEEQKSSRSRARQFSLETNKRWKALGERRKQWELQQQQQREEVLQRRREQVQEVTERFQRAHIVSNQKARKSSQRKTENIEDALSKIQAAWSSYSRTSCFLTINENINRNSPLSPKPPPTPPVSSQAHSAVESYTELLQEQCRLVKGRDCKPQMSQDEGLPQTCCSDSVSSKDSLEEDKDGRDKPGSPRSFFLHSESAPPEQKEPKESCFSFSLMRAITKEKASLSEAKLDDSSELQDVAESETEEGEEQAKSQSSTGDLNLLTLYDLISGEEEEEEEPDGTSSPKHHSVSTVTSSIDVDTNQTVLLDRKQCFHDAHRPDLLSDSEASVVSKDIDMDAPPTTNPFLLAEREAPRLSFQQGSAANDLYEVCDFDCETHDLRSAPPPPRSGGSKAETINQEVLTEDDLKFTLLGDTPQEGQLKGILKKQSKYSSRSSAPPPVSGQPMLTKDVAKAIRDSVELTRAKASYAEAMSSVKKKLRWLDEVEKEEEKLNEAEEAPSDVCPATIDPEETHITPVIVNLNQVAKEAWADVGIQVNLLAEQGDESGFSRSTGRTSGSRIPKRVRGAREGAGTGSGPYPGQTRKGTVVRPQSTIEVSHMPQAQGAVLIPRPPPRYGRMSERALKKATSAPGRKPSTAVQSATIYTKIHPYTLPASEAYVRSAPHSGQRESCSCRRGVNGVCLDCTPTDEEISLLWNGVRNALSTSDADSGRKPCVDESARVRNSVSRRHFQPPQPRKGNSFLVNPYKGSESAAQHHLSHNHTTVPEESRSSAVATETAPTLGSASTRRDYLQQWGLRSISSEERKLLHSLDRLDQHLHCLQSQVGTRIRTFIDSPSTKGGKLINSFNHRASSASRLRSKKKT